MWTTLLDLIMAGISECGFLSTAQSLCVECVNEVCVRETKW